MIFMRVGKQYGIELLYLCPQHLIPKVGRGINNQGGLGRLYQNAAAQAIIPRISRSTNRTSAANHGHPTAGAATQKCDGDGRIGHTYKLGIATAME